MKNLGQVTENQDIARKQDIPTNTSDLTNDSGFITGVKTLKTDNTTSQSISAGEALNGSGTINLHRIAKTGDFSHIQNRYDAYISWGGNVAGGASPVDVAINSTLNPNRLAFMDADDISIEYSTDGGNTWVDYGVSDENKIKFVSGLGTQNYFCGGTGSNSATNYQIRVTITPTIGRLYFRMRKIHIYLSENGCTGNKVTVSGKYFGSDTFKGLATYNVAGWSGWNTISMTAPVGGLGTSQTTNIQSLRFTFYYTGKQNAYPNAQLSISQLLIFGEAIWSSTNNMQKNGTIYSYDYAQNVSFPANLTINKTKLINNASSGINVNLPTQAGTLALTNQIPTVNNGTLTIQKNGTTVKTFTANQSSNVTANITVPTKTSDLTNDSGFITSADLPSGGGVTSVVGQTGDVTVGQIKSAMLSISGGFAIGDGAVSGGGVAIGENASSINGGGIALGKNTDADNGSIAIGYNAKCFYADSVQIGTGTNYTQDSLQFKDYQLVNANGYVPVARNSIAQTTYSNLTSNNTVTVLFTGTVSSGNISISGGKALKDYRMIFILGTNASNNGTEWLTFYGWQFAYMVSVGSSYINSVKICSSDNFGFWNVSLASLSSTTTITTLGTNMKIYRILGVD